MGERATLNEVLASLTKDEETEFIRYVLHNDVASHPKAHLRLISGKKPFTSEMAYHITGLFVEKSGNSELFFCDAARFIQWLKLVEHYG